MNKPKGGALVFIFITLLIDVIGFGIIIPVIPSLIAELTGEGIAAAAQYGGWLMFSYASIQFLSAPILGGLSDQYGRRPVILISLLGLGLDYIIVALAPSISWLFFARMVAGITGASFTTASAYIADISTPEKRAQNFGIIGMAFGLGFIIGPVIGGVLGQFGSRIPFYAAAGLTLLNWLYGYFILPESLPKENRRAFSWKRANPVGTLKQLGQYPVILGLVATLLLMYIAAHSTQSTWTYYTIEKFDWDEAMIGYSLGFLGLMVAIVQGGLIRVVIPKIGQRRGVYIGLTFYVIGFTLFAIASDGWMMIAFIIPYTLGGLAGPSLQGIMTGQVPANAQGELQGGITSVISITSVIGPPLMTNLFAWFTNGTAGIYFPGAPFLLGALFTLLGIVLAKSSLNQVGN